MYYIIFKFVFMGGGVGCKLWFWSRICDSNVGSRSYHTVSKNKESPGKARQMAKPMNGRILEQTKKTDKISLGLASAMTSSKSVVPGLQSTEHHSTDIGKGWDRKWSPEVRQRYYSSRGIPRANIGLMKKCIWITEVFLVFRSTFWKRFCPLT